MAEIKEARAPYNFVPFSGKVIRRYQNEEALPRHDEMDPTLLSGEIRVTLTADTPVFVSDGAEHFARGTDGSYQIPGSTVRGMIRENMQILGLGLIRPEVDFEDIRLFYRDMTSARGSVTNELKEHYKTALGITTVKTKSGQYTVARNVRGGYLHREGDNYYIVPVQGGVLNISRKNPIVSQWAKQYAFEQKIWYRASGETVTAVSGKAADGYLQGTLLSPGRIGKQNRLYLFPREDSSAEVMKLTKEEVLSYCEDFEMKKNGLRGTDMANPMDPTFWKMPEDGGCKAVFYVRYQGFTSFGVSQFLRLGYIHRLSDGLPRSHRIDTDEIFLDYPYAILGYAGKRSSYRSRVCVGDFRANGSPEEQDVIPIILGGPKPSFHAGYVAGGKNYNQDDFQLNGLKQYWLKDAQRPENVEKMNVASKLRPLPRGTSFTGSIRYQNLHKDELGLLLWCLRLDEGCYQSVGMGKPYGYGRMKVSIDSLLEYDQGVLYSSLIAKPVIHGQTADRVEELICAYDQQACRKAYIKDKGGEKATLRSLGSIQDFLYMKRTVRKDTEQISYMELREHRNIQSPLARVAEIRQSQQNAVQPPPEQEDWKAKLAAVYNQPNHQKTQKPLSKKKNRW